MFRGLRGVVLVLCLAVAASTSVASNSSAQEVGKSRTLADTEGLPQIHPHLMDGPALPEEAHLQQAEVDAYAEYRGITSAQASRLLVTEHRVRPLLANLRTEYPDTFAGLWVNEDTVGEVTVAFSGSLEATVPEVQQLFYNPSLLQFRQATVALRDLEGLRDRIQADIDALPELAGVTSWYVNEPANKVNIGVEALTPSIVLTLQQLYGDDRIETAQRSRPVDFDIPPASSSCRARSHCNPLRGGTRLHFPGQPALFCTIGFNAYDKVYTHVKFVLTAGHCARTYTHHSDSNIGVESLWRNSGNVDARRVEIREPWARSNWVYVLASVPASPITSVWRGGALGRGTALCSSGMATGWNCGEVTNGSVSANGYSGMLGYSMCLAGGDSGGSLINSNTAIGLVKGAYSGDSCGTNWGSYIGNVENALSVYVAVN